MITVTKYDLSSGDITGNLTCELDLIDRNLSENEGFVVGIYDPKNYVVSDGKVVDRVYDQELKFEEESSQVKLLRDSMLLQSDWTQLPDSPVDKSAWAEYRQALRDLTSQEGFPSNVNWPVKP